MASQAKSHLRCRLGFHKWTRYKTGDKVAGSPEAPAGFREAANASTLGVAMAYGTGQDEWETRCRYCQKRKRLLEM